jgi:AbrB family looped-hinge helix DNA binding protein
MRITTKGQVTIPQDVRDRLGLLPHTEVQFRVEGDVAVLQKVTGGGDRGHALVRRMRGTGTIQMTTDEILALTRDAVVVSPPRRVRSVARARPRSRGTPSPRRPR